MIFVRKKKIIKKLFKNILKKSKGGLRPKPTAHAYNLCGHNGEFFFFFSFCNISR